MKLSTYAIILALLALLYGIALLIFPVQFLQNYGITLDAPATVIARLFGSAMCGYALTFWINRNIPAPDKSWAGLLSSSVFFNAANFVVVLMAKMNGIGNSMSWSTIILSAILALCSLYFISRKK